MLLPLALHVRALAGLRERAGWLVVLAAAQMAGPFLLLGFAEERISSSLTSILVAATPLLVAILALGLDRPKAASGARLGGLVVGFGGVALLLGLGCRDRFRAVIGALAALGTALGYAFSALLLKTKSRGCDGRGVVGMVTALSSLMLLPLALATVPPQFPPATPSRRSSCSGPRQPPAASSSSTACRRTSAPAARPWSPTPQPWGVAVLLGVAFSATSPSGSTVAGLALILLGSRWQPGPRATDALFGFLASLRTARSTSGP